MLRWKEIPRLQCDGDVMVVGAWGLWEDLLMEGKWEDGQGSQVGCGKSACERECGAHIAWGCEEGQGERMVLGPIG